MVGGGSGSFIWRLVSMVLRNSSLARPELTHGAAHRAAQLGQVLRPEDEQGDDEDEDQLLKTDVEHGAAQ